MVYILKSKQVKNVEKQQELGKSAFFAFFRGKGKLAKIRAIFREYKIYVRCFISTNKVQNLASRNKIVLMKINVK